MKKGRGEGQVSREPVTTALVSAFGIFPPPLKRACSQALDWRVPHRAVRYTLSLTRRVKTEIPANILSELPVGRNATIFAHRRTCFPLFLIDLSAASRIFTTRNPAWPSLKGVRLFVMQSAK